MARAQESYNKKEKEKKKAKKREEKLKKKEARKADSLKGASLEDMLVYVDENGQLTSTPPDPTQKTEIDAEDIVIGIPPKEDLPEEEVINNGKVSYFNNSKGFGFIIHQQTNEKHFFHISGLIDDVDENDKVSFDLEKGQRGLNAVNVKKI
jgi:cold shock CspA family protein